MFELIHSLEEGKITVAIAGGKNPKTSYQYNRYSEEELKKCLPEKDYKKYKNDQAYEYWGWLPLFSTLCSFCSDGEPLILYTAEDGGCDTCLDMFLKYGKGQCPNFTELTDMRTCMNDYDGDLVGAVKKLDQLMEIMFPENLYTFQYCAGMMADLDGNFTWDRYQTHHYVPYASAMTHVGMYVRISRTTSQANIAQSGKNDLPASCMIEAICLLASQPPESFSKERVDYYRQQIRSGKKVGCIAYEIEGLSNYALILDGHHRVIASMLEGVFPDCLLISKVHYELITEKDKTYIKLPDHLCESKKKSRILVSSESANRLGAHSGNMAKISLSEREKLELYAFYRNNYKLNEIQFPEEYGAAAKKMAASIKNRME